METEFTLPVGQVVKALRKGRKWSQQRLAEEAGVEQSLVCYVETKPVGLRVRTLERLALALGLKLSELVARAETLRDAA